MVQVTPKQLQEQALDLLAEFSGHLCKVLKDMPGGEHEDWYFSESGAAARELRLTLAQECEATPGFVGGTTSPGFALLAAMLKEAQAKGAPGIISRQAVGVQLRQLALEYEAGAGRASLSEEAMVLVAERVKPYIVKYEQLMLDKHSEYLVHEQYQKRLQKMSGTQKRGRAELKVERASESDSAPRSPRFPPLVISQATALKAVFGEPVCWKYLSAKKKCAGSCGRAPCCLKTATELQKFAEAEKEVAKAG